MKYQNIAAFEKHLNGAPLQQLSHAYAIVGLDGFEAEQVCKKILAAAVKENPNLLFATCDLSVPGAKSSQLMATLIAPSLFDEGVVAVFYGAEKLSKEDIDKLIQFIHCPISKRMVIFVSRLSSSVSRIYAETKNDLIVLDVASEKPWDKEKRLSDWLASEARLQGRELQTQVADYLVGSFGTDMATLSSELEKLITYCGDKKSVSMGDARVICQAQVQMGSWACAEEMVWGSGNVVGDPPSTVTDMIMLLGGLKYNFEIGLRLCDALSLKKGQDLSQLFPKLRPQKLAQYEKVARARGPLFFKNGLMEVIETECLMKSTAASPAVLWDMLRGKSKVMSK